MYRLFKRLCFLFFILFSLITNAQRKYAKILDEDTKEPIPYATIVYGENSGIIANELGVFSLNQDVISHIDSILISCIGYESKLIKQKQIKDSVFFLNPSSINLPEIVLTNKELSPLEIIVKVKENMPNNYKFDYQQRQVFYRGTNSQEIKELKTELLKTTLKEIHQGLLDSIVQLIPKNMAKYTEILADLAQAKQENEIKLSIIKAIKHQDTIETSAVSLAKDNLLRFIEKYMDKDSSIRIKSGIIKIGGDIAIDSINSSSENTRDTLFNDNFLSNMKISFRTMFNELFYSNNTQIDFFEKLDRYSYETEGIIDFNGKPVYVLLVKPKSNNARFVAKLFIDIYDYAVIKLEAANKENKIFDKGFNMFGINYNTTSYEQVAVFNKNDNDKYSLNYLKLVSSEEFSIDRKLQIKEKNKFKKSNKIVIRANVGISNIYTEEIFVNKTDRIDKLKFSNFNENPGPAIIYPKFYDYKLWKDFNIIEPEDVLKNFKIE